jgi:hypothetical protein
MLEGDSVSVKMMLPVTSLFLAIVDATEIVNNTVIWGLSLAIFPCADIFDGCYVAVFLARRDGCLQESLPIPCSIQLPNPSHFNTERCYLSDRALCFPSVGVSIFRVPIPAVRGFTAVFPVLDADVARMP